jgi:signal peptidase II
VQGRRRVPIDLAHPGRVFLGTALGILFVDQITKAIVRAWMPERVTYGLIPHVIRLTSVRNSGAAFGLFPGRQPVFVATSLLVLFVIAAYWRRAHPRQWPVVIALAMVAAGALGNLIDRAVVGLVTDFLEFTFVSFPVFNVADIGIVCGVGLLMVWILFGPEPPEPAHELAGTEPSEPELAG